MRRSLLSGRGHAEHDIESLRASADLISRCLGVVAPYVTAGTTTAELDTIAETFLRDHNARPAFKGYDPGWGGGPFTGTCCISVNDAVVHGIPGPYVLREGDIVTVDVGCVLDGWYGDSAFTFAVGEIDADARHLLTVTYQSLLNGAAEAIVGRRVGDIGHAVQRTCEAEGFGVVRELVGHGIGRTLHEEPSVPNFGMRGTGRKLVEGTHRVRHHEDRWTVLTADGSLAAHYEQTVVVRRGQPEVLTTFSHIEQAIGLPFAEPAPAVSASPLALGTLRGSHTSLLPYGQEKRHRTGRQRRRGAPERAVPGAT